METKKEKRSNGAASLRWGILRSALLSSQSSPAFTAAQNLTSAKRISRKAGGFNLISCRELDKEIAESLRPGSKDVYMSYKLPVGDGPELILMQRMEDCIDLVDFEVSSKCGIDTTGLVCSWPSEDVLAYFCINRPNMFRSKRVLELGSGYGLAGFAIAASSEATEVVISDGNPQVVDYIQHSIRVNSGSFGSTKVSSMTLHWSQDISMDVMNSFDIIVASDCTFFKDFHEGLARTVKSMLKITETSEAIFLSPKRGDSLSKFLKTVEDFGLHYELVANYDDVIWNLHKKLLHHDDTSWPNYDKDHSYPLLVRITFSSTKLPCHTQL